MTDRDLWIIVYRALNMIVKAIARKYGLGEYKDLEPSETDTYSGIMGS